jgi:hypothetical protein
MPNEFIARNGVISRGNLIVSGSLVTTQPTTLSGSLSLAGDLNFQPGASGATRYISMSASPTEAVGNSIVIKAGDATTSGNGGSITLTEGFGSVGGTRGTINIGTSGYTTVNLGGGININNSGPNTGTALTVNAGGQTAMRFDWDNPNTTITAVTAGTRVLRFTGASQYQVRGSGTTSSTTAFRVQNANASSSLSVRDDGEVTVGGSIGLPVSSYVYWGDVNSAIQHTGAATNFRTYQDNQPWSFITANNSSVQAKIDTGYVRVKTGFSAVGNSPITMSGWDGGGGTAGNVLLVKGGNSGVGTSYAGGNGSDLILENGLATDNSLGFGGTPGSIIFKYGTYSNTASVEYGRLNSSGNFLIGTTAGSAKLLISGSSNSALLEIDSPAVNNILFVSGSGNVGIGTGTPRTALDVNGTISVGASGSSGTITFPTTVSGFATSIFTTYANNRLTIQCGGNTNIQFNSWIDLISAGNNIRIDGGIHTTTLSTNNVVRFANSGSAAVNTTYFSSTNVGINTTSPSAKLHVVGSGTTSSTTSLLVQNANASSSLVVNDAGYVGIGASPSATSPVYLYQNTGSSISDLEIFHEYPSSLSQRAYTNLTLTSKQLNGNHGSQYINFRHVGGNVGTFVGGALAFDLYDGSTGYSYFQLQTKVSGQSLATRFAIDNNGNTLLGRHGGNESIIITEPTFTSTSPLPAKTIGIVSNKQASGWGGFGLIIKAGPANNNLSTNLKGGELYLRAGESLGTGGSDILLQIPTPSGSSGTVLNSTYRTAMFISGSGNVGIGTSTPTATLDVSGSGRFTNSLTVTGSFTVTTGSLIEFQVNQTGVKIGNATTDSHAVTGSVSISSSFSTSGSALTVYKSGSSVLDIQGSQGQLFSVIDALSGSLMSVNDVSGLPILEVFSDDRVVMGTYGAPGLTVSGSLATVATGSSAPAGTAPEGTFRFAVVGGLYYIYAYIGGAWRSGSLS